MIYKLLAAGAIAAAIALGGYFKGRHDVTVVLERERAVHKAEFDKQAAETARVQTAWDSIVGERDAIRQELDDAFKRGNDLGERLRNYQRAGRCRLPETPAAAAGTDETARVDSLDERIGDVTKRIIAACAVEGPQLEEVLARYEAARSAQR